MSQIFDDADVVELSLSFDRDYWNVLRRCARVRKTSVTKLILELVDGYIETHETAEFCYEYDDERFFLSETQSTMLHELCFRQQKIQAIKKFREYTGANLMICKSLVERHFDIY